MKKSLIALAALATVATGAQAQSNVTIYGIIDSGVVSSNGAAAGRATGVSSGALSTSRLGFRGTEDLGGGLRANFNLEGGLDIGTGSTANNPGAMFDRQSWVGLDKSGVGSVLFGRTTRLDFDAIVGNDAFGASGFGSAGQTFYAQVAATSPNSSIASGSASANRYVNSIKAATARISGFQLSYQHSFGEQAGNDSASRGTAYSLDYTMGKAKATYAYSRQNTAAGSKDTETTTLSGSYDFGVAKAFVGMAELERVNQANKVKGSWIGATAPVNAKVAVMAQYYKLDNMGYAAANDADAYALGATYAFSKRTTAYAMYGRANNEGAGALNMVVGTGLSTGATAAGKDQTAYAVGVRHSF